MEMWAGSLRGSLKPGSSVVTRVGQALCCGLCVLLFHRSYCRLVMEARRVTVFSFLLLPLHKGQRARVHVQGLLVSVVQTLSQTREL